MTMQGGYSVALADTIRARDLVTPLHEVHCVQVEDDPTAAAESLLARQFETAPLLSGSLIIGTVTRAELAAHGAPGEHYRPIYDGNVISADMALHDLFALMCCESFLLVLEGQQFVGVLTPVDLGRPPSRTYFYLLLAELEIALADIVRLSFPEQADAVALLSPGRQEAQRKLVDVLRAQDEFLDDVAALGMVDLLDVVRKVPTLAVHYEDGRWSTRKLLDGMGAFRNDVMHPVRDFLTITSVDVGRLVDFDARLRHLASASHACLENLQHSAGAAGSPTAP